MENLITVKEAIRKGYLKIGDIVEMDSTILPHHSRVMITAKESGVNELQYIFRRNTKFYYVGNDDDIVKLVSTKTTSSKLTLRGETGFENGLSIMNRICSQLFSMKSLGIFAAPLNDEEFKEYFIQEKTEKFIGNLVSTGESFLATPYVKKTEGDVDNIPDLSYGFKCFLGNVELIGGEIERSGQLGIVPTIKMYSPEYIYFDNENGTIPRIKVM